MPFIRIVCKSAYLMRIMRRNVRLYRGSGRDFRVQARLVQRVMACETAQSTDAILVSEVKPKSHVYAHSQPFVLTCVFAKKYWLLIKVDFTLDHTGLRYGLQRDRAVISKS